MRIDGFVVVPTLILGACSCPSGPCGLAIGLARGATELDVAAPVQELLLQAVDTAATEWIACGFGSVAGGRIRIERLTWAVMASTDANGATGTCPATPDLVAIAHPHLPKRVAGRENLCAASELDRRAHRVSRVRVMLILCPSGRYAFLTHPRGREHRGGFTARASSPVIR